MSASTTLTPTTDLPTGAVRLLTDALASSRPGLRWVCQLRAAHAAWLLRGLDDDRRRVALVHVGDDLVGVALAVRYDARPSPARLGLLTVVALLTGAVAGLVGLPPAVLFGAVGTAVAAGVVGAVLLDGRDGLTGARQAQRRANELGRDRCWGRGLVAVAPGHHGRGLGTALTRELVATLPPGDRWLPVALTAQAAGLYRRLGAVGIGGAASELLRAPTGDRPALRLVTAAAAPRAA